MTLKRAAATRRPAPAASTAPSAPATRSTSPGGGARLLEGSIQIPKNVKMFIYGFSDVGKTLLASGIPLRGWPKDADGELLPQYGHIIDDVLYCDADGGLASLITLGAVVKNVYPSDGSRFSTTDQMEKIPEVARRLGVTRVVVDTFSRYQESLLNKKMGSDYSLKLQDWGYIRNVFSKMCSELADLGVDLICTAHADDREDETQPKVRVINPITKAPELKHPERILPAIQGAFRHLVHGHFDMVAFYRLEWDAKGKPVRKLYTRQSKRIGARSKYALLPAVIENPDWPMIKGLYTEGREKLVEALTKENPGLTIVD